MVASLPYRATTASGECFDISFPLHPQTASPTRVARMLSAILGALDAELRAELRINPATGNGDVLQAVAMTLAIRASMIEAPKDLTDQLSVDLLAVALAAMRDAERRCAYLGHA